MTGKDSPDSVADGSIAAGDGLVRGPGGETINTKMVNTRGTLDTVNATIEVNESVELTDRE